MIKATKRLVFSILHKFGFTLIKLPVYSELIKKKRVADEFSYLKTYPTDRISRYLDAKSNSTSQLGQELFVLLEMDFKKDGFFVEFGATNGISLNNTFLLEKEFNWKGILAEPAQCWHKELESNRTAIIDKRCVWRESGENKIFNEAENASLSTIQGYGSNDNHNRTNNRTYEVETITLVDLLKYHAAPILIDYLSIDTEGSEFDILNSFDFDQYKIGLITVEHNYTPIRKDIFNLLVGKGYRRVHQQYSKFDDWYILD